MSLKDNIEQLIEKENAYQSEDARVAPFCYTQTAYDNDEVDGVEEYSFRQEQNIPVGTPEVLETSSKILKSGVRSSSSSLSRMLINHFFGRVSYNLNKIHDNFYAFLNTFHAGLGQPNGLATLDANGRLPYSMLPESAVELKGSWNAQTNTPTLQDGTGTLGDTYIVEVAGTVNLGSGDITFNVNDNALYNGTKWILMPAGSVRTVNNKQPVNGSVTLYGADIPMSESDSQKVSDAINDKVPLSSTVNGKSLSTSITLYGTDIPMSETDDTTVADELDNKVSKTRTVNNKALSADIELTASDIPLTAGSTENVSTELTNKVPKTRTVNGKALTNDVELTGFDIPVSKSDTRKINEVLGNTYKVKTYTYTVNSNASLAYWLSNGNTGTSSGGNDFSSVLIKKGSFSYAGIFVPLDTLGTKEINGETGAEIIVPKIGYSTKSYRADCKMTNVKVSGTLENMSNISYCESSTFNIFSTGSWWSVDGKNWRRRQGYSSLVVNTIVYANGLWVSGTSRAKYINWSTDGKNWTEGTGIFATVYSVTYANGLWCTGRFWSTDGKNWTLGTGISDTVYSVTYAKGLWVAGSVDSIYWSTDGKNWTNRFYADWSIHIVTYANGLWCTGRFWSTDGKNWTEGTGIPYTIYALTYADGLWVASSNNNMYWSTDGKNWTLGTGISDTVYSVTYANGLWCTGRFWSTDGKNWTEGTGISDTVYSVTYAEGLWVAVSVFSPGSYWSTDGKNWTAGTDISDTADKAVIKVKGFELQIKNSLSVQNCIALFEGSYATPNENEDYSCAEHPEKGFNLS